MKKYTVITGACGGLGRSFVKACAKNKENLILSGTSEKKLEKLMKDFSEEFKDIDVKTVICDLSKPEDRKAVVEFAKKNKLEVNRLINNAGVIIEGDTLKFEDDEILTAIEVNCKGTVDLTMKFLRERNKDEKFEVLTVASVASSYPIPHMAVYAATKSFLVSMMISLAIELKDENVVITTVCPGGMATSQAMKDSIKSMGLGGKLSCTDTDKVAKISLKALKKKKKVVVTGGFNKFLVFVGKPFSKTFLAKSTGRIWKKSQDKRGFWYVFIIFFKNRVDKSCYLNIIKAMKEINTQESNLFSRNIVELKLISDRIAEGKGESAGIFSNTYQILYILDRKETVTPKELIAELNIAKSNLAILAKKMIKDGQIESHKDKYNKREIYYNITSVGREMLQEKLDNIDTVCEGDTKKVTNLIIRVLEELKKLENKNASSKRRKTNAK